VRVFREGGARSLHKEILTFRIAIVPEGNGGEEVKGLLRKLALLDLIVGDKTGLCF
jgi:hypothetical protein